MKKEARGALKAFLVELVFYAALVVVYFFLVLHLLGGWLHDLSSHHRYIYAMTINVNYFSARKQIEP